MNLPSYSEALRKFRHEYMRQALEEAQGNQCLAADLIGVHRNTMSRLLRDAGITRYELRAYKEVHRNIQARKDVHA
jgi:Fis family transcriptional regulator